MRVYHQFKVSNGDEIFPVTGIVDMEIVISGGLVNMSWYMMFEGHRIKPVWVTAERLNEEKKIAIRNAK